MYEKETVANRVMGVLEVVSRYVGLNFAYLLSVFPFAVVFFLILRFGFGIQKITLGASLHTGIVCIACGWWIVLCYQSVSP